MFQELWLETCGVCLDDKEFYFVNECKCTSLVCKSCLKHIDRCPFCRQDYKLDIKSVVKSSESSIFLESDVSTFVTPLPGVFPSSSLSRRDARKAKENWNYWFYRFSGRDIMRSHLQQEIFNHDIIHQLLRTGRFNEPTEGGLCLDRRMAYTFVRHQLEVFIHTWRR